MRLSPDPESGIVGEVPESRFPSAKKDMSMGRGILDKFGPNKKEYLN